MASQLPILDDNAACVELPPHLASRFEEERARFGTQKYGRGSSCSRSSNEEPSFFVPSFFHPSIMFTRRFRSAEELERELEEASKRKVSEKRGRVCSFA
jgi:hypothetical protein